MTVSDLTYPIIMAAAKDAGNRNMRKHGRTVWSEDDYEIVCATFGRLAKISPHVVTP